MSDFRFDVDEAAGPKRLFSARTLATLAHAYLFTGAAGVGKKRFARLLAQSILCEGNTDAVLGYDGTCPSCLLVGAGTHPDLFVHTGEIKIGDRDGKGGDELTARDLVRALSLHAYGNGRRVLILEDIEFATHHAANALLKFFEEPPRGVVLILTTSAVGKLLGTIRSRLVEVPFPPLSGAAVARILASRGIATADIERIGAAAQGSLTRAQELLDERGLREQVAAWFFAAVAGQSADGAWATRATLEEGLDLAALLIRDWAVMTADADVAGLSGERLRLRSLPTDASTALAALAALGDARRLARTNVSPALVAEGLRLALASSMSSIGA